jgi:hypothetical protein
MGGTTGSRSVVTRSRIGWLAGFLVGLIGVFVVANLGVVAAERRLPSMDDYYDVRAHDVVHDMDRLHAAGVHSDAVLVGTSQMARGGVPRAIEAQTGFKYIHNVALPGASTEVVKRWMLDEVVPRIHPRRVIWGVSSIDFNGGRPNPVIAKYDGARATRPGVLGTADRTLASMVPLARRRVELRAPIQLAEDLRAGKPPALQRDKRPIDKLLGPMRTGTGKKLQRAYTYLRRQQLADFKATPPYVNAFTSTLRDLKAQGIETVVVIMPVPTLFRAAHPKGAAQYEAWKAMAIKAARDSGAKVLDLNHTEPDVDFPDYVHLTRPAALSWSTLLGQDLHAELGWGTSGATGSGSTSG